MSIKNTILSDPVNRFLFFTANTDVFIVGGYIRDILRGMISKDKDYAIKDNVKNIAGKVAKRFDGTLVALKPPTTRDRVASTYRVVLKNRFRGILDFSSLQGSIDEDLKRRDFTINAIAWSPKTGIIDPSGGKADLKRRIIKVVRTRNLLDDPLRIIRAYRVAGELGFKIEQSTRKNLRRYSSGLVKVASERITEEVFKLIVNKDATPYIKQCYKDRVLERIFKINTESLKANIRLLNKLDLLIRTLPRKPKKYLKEEISQGLNRMGIIRLALLFLNTHLPDGSQVPLIENTRLRVSNIIQRALTDIYNGYSIAIKDKGSLREISKDRLFKVFNTAGNRVFEVCIVLSIVRGYNTKRLLAMAEDYLKIKDKILLNGEDIQRILHITPCKEVGKMLLSLKEAQFRGGIKNRAEAESWLLANFT